MKFSVTLCTIFVILCLNISCEANSRTKRTLNVLLRYFGYQIVPVDTELISPNPRNPRLNNMRLQTVTPRRVTQSSTTQRAPLASTNPPAMQQPANMNPGIMQSVMNQPASMSQNVAMPQMNGAMMQQADSPPAGMEMELPTTLPPQPESSTRSRLEDMMIRSQETDNEFIIRMVSDLNKNAQMQAEDVENINGMEVNTPVKDQSEDDDEEGFLSKIPELFTSSNFAKDSGTDVKSEKLIKYVPQGQQHYVSQYFQPPATKNEFYNFGDNFEIVKSKDMSDQYVVGNSIYVADSHFAPQFKPLPFTQGLQAQSGMHFNSNGHNFKYNSFH